MMKIHQEAYLCPQLQCFFCVLELSLPLAASPVLNHLCASLKELFLYPPLCFACRDQSCCRSVVWIIPLQSLCSTATILSSPRKCQSFSFLRLVSLTNWIVSQQHNYSEFPSLIASRLAIINSCLISVALCYWIPTVNSNCIPGMFFWGGEGGG